MIKLNLSHLTAYSLFLLTAACGSSPNQSGTPASGPSTSILNPNSNAPGTIPNSSDQDVHETTTPEVSPTPSPTPSLYPTSASAVGWKTIMVQAWSAKSTLDAFAHFTTTRNACGRDADGVLSLEDWNNFVSNLNQVVQKDPTAEPYCVAPPDAYPYMDDHVEVDLDLPSLKGKRVIYELKDGQICSSISDHQLSDALLSDIHKFIKTADKTDVDRSLCPWVQP